MQILNKINNPSDLKKLKKKQLKLLADEIREFLIDSVSKTGGHLASNLGVVELTIALHRVFNTPSDTIVWDVGHQTYVHKILTGRKNDFASLRKFGGISGFPRAIESEHDCFDAGHSSTSISAALGFACARDLKGKKNSVIAVIGDGAMSGGLAYEGLNNAGRLKTNFIVILNNNEMSISKNVGSMSKYLNRLRAGAFYNSTKKGVEYTLNKIPKIGKYMSAFLRRVKDSIKHLVVPSSIFEQLGFTCIGPIDGHDTNEMIEVLKHAKKINGPVLLHVYTKKGKGYSFAEKKPCDFHGVGEFNVETGEPCVCDGNRCSSSKAFGKALIEIAANNEKVVAITAAMPDGTGLKEFAGIYRKRFFDVGIAEQHAVTFAGGMAKMGMIPVVAVYSTFMQRGYDQIFHDIALQKLHVVFALDRSGLVGEDGETHHGIYDISYLSHLPNVSILAPSNITMLTKMLDYAVNIHNAPIAIRYPKYFQNLELDIDFVFGKANIIKSGSDITIVAVGNMLNTAIEATKISGINAEIIDVGTIKPLDIETIKKSGSKTGKIIVLEDNVKIGGVASMIKCAVTTPVVALSYDDKPITHGALDVLYKENGVDVESVAEVIKKECGN